MWQDPIVEEVRRHRQEYSARFNYDVRAICREERERQKLSHRRVVSLPAKRPASTTSEPGA